MSEELQELMNSNPEWYKNLLLIDVKEFIRSNINSASRSFIAIGYYLKYIRDNQMFSVDGYQSIWEFAQSEFGIGKSSASRFININDRFSKDGNSPILLEQYKDFSSSKLSEMLTMTDEQIDQVTITTTVAEIREIKQPVKEEVVATSQQIPLEEFKPCKFGGGKCNLWTDPSSCSGKTKCKSNYIEDESKIDIFKTNAFEEAAKQMNIPKVDQRILNDIAKWCINKLKDTLQLQIEVHGFDSSMEQLLIMNLQTNAIRPINNYSVFFSKTYVKITDHEFDLSENLLYMDIDQEIHRIWNEVVPDVEYVDYSSEVEDDVDEIEMEEVEIVEADIIQTEYATNDNGKEDGIREIIRVTPVRHEDDPDCPAGMGPKRGGCTRMFTNESFDDAKGICKWCWDGYLRRLISEDRDLKEPIEIAIPKIIQPELPILKNNDTRKDFIDAYTTWPIWIDAELTGERYYRFDFTNGESFVIRVSLCRKYLGWEKGYSKEVTYGKEEYFLLKDNLPFVESETNKSTMIEYLKDIQKK